MSVAPHLIARPAACALLVVAMAAPAHAGVHYQAVTRTTDAQSRPHEVQVEGWVAGVRARVEFHTSDNPIASGSAAAFSCCHDPGHPPRGHYPASYRSWWRTQAMPWGRPSSSRPFGTRSR
jgi:hypothetical protein